MKKLFLVMFLFLPLLVNAQKAIETVKLSNGKYITVYDDYTWKNSTQSEIDEVKKSNSKTSTSSALPARTSTEVKSKSSTSSSSSSTQSSVCGARTKKGGYCKRVVKGGGRCYQHR